MMSKQVSEESSPLLADLGLAVRDTKPFFAGAGKFNTLTFFSQPVGYSPAYRYHPFSFSFRSNIADLLYFLAYATTNLVGSNNRGLAEIIARRPSGRIRENLWPFNNSCLKEVIMACQYPCIANVQRPSLCELVIVTTMKCCSKTQKH